MTSTVTNYSQYIDTNYPIPGVDNDTQGFRSNFSAIQNAFTVVSTEVSKLQSQTTYQVVLTQPSSSKGTAGDLAGMIYANSNTVYICYNNYTTGAGDIWAKVSTDSQVW